MLVGYHYTIIYFLTDATRAEETSRVRRSEVILDQLLA